MEEGEETDSAPSAGHRPQPERTDTPAEYVAALRALKTWSGLAYRQLQGKAAARGNPLPSSTIATTLGRATLPREAFVTAFTRACGLDDNQVRQWLDSRRRIAMGTTATPVTEPQDSFVERVEELRRPPARWPQFLYLLMAVAVGVAGTLGVQALLSRPDRAVTLATVDPVPGLAISSVGSWAWIQPVRTPELCLSDGVDRTQRYPTAVAVQRPCDQASPPRVYLEPLGKATVQIQWHHPTFGIGCLTVLTDGPARDLLEPRHACADDNPAQRFRVEPTGPPAAAHFHLRPALTDNCLSLRDQDTAPLTEIIQAPCSGARDQEFLITLIPPT
ncbi:RICIN domain-containing protein [Nocardia sp. NPDC052566]|uniref:RICIN domain-containing protein n=1 Tax=Nocardia sp. NPDC052566 TaxID=3364330 RepID=UPI0037C7F615